MELAPLIGNQTRPKLHLLSYQTRSEMFGYRIVRLHLYASCLFPGSRLPPPMKVTVSGTIGKLKRDIRAEMEESENVRGKLVDFAIASFVNSCLNIGMSLVLVRAIRAIHSQTEGTKRSER